MHTACCRLILPEGGDVYLYISSAKPHPSAQINSKKGKKISSFPKLWYTSHQRVCCLTQLPSTKIIKNKCNLHFDQTLIFSQIFNHGILWKIRFKLVFWFGYQRSHFRGIWVIIRNQTAGWLMSQKTTWSWKTQADVPPQNILLCLIKSSSVVKAAQKSSLTQRHTRRSVFEV